MNLENRWMRAAVPSLLISGAIGTIYCFSSYSQALCNALGFGMGYVGWCFSIAIFFLGMSAAFMGPLVEKNIHKASLVALSFFVSGTVCSALTIQFSEFLSGIWKWLPLISIYISYMLIGVGLGTGYICSPKTLILWFKENPGLGVGLSIAGFGLAKTLFTPVMVWLQQICSISTTLYILAGIYLVMMYIGHLLLRKPKGWVEPDTDASFLTTFKMFKDRKFCALWLLFFINITCGLALIPYETQLIQWSFGFLSSATILTLIGIIPAISALFNAGGRVGYASITDNMERKQTIYAVIYGLSILASIAGCFISQSWTGSIIVVALLMIINAGYGGGFSTVPAILKQFYGMDNISKIHGMILTAWSFAGLCGNNFAQSILSRGYGFRGVIFGTLILYVIAFIIGFLMLHDSSSKTQNKD